jgi:hypothetical protein
MRLAAARSLAWALWLSGWLLLGEFGHRQGSLWFGGLLPLALWLLAIGALLGVRRPLPTPGLAGGLAVATMLAAWGHAEASTGALVLGWAMLVVAASRVVRQLRHGRPHGAPLAPACVGALLAWSLADAPAWISSAALLVGPLLLVLLMPWSGKPASGCRAGLFDCALPVAAWAPWRVAACWPQLAALLAMLPMMAGLSMLADACSAAGWSHRTESALHLAAMLLPPLLLQAPLRVMAELTRQRWIALLLLAGGAALWLQPGVQGLMVAMLLHGLAWGLAWGGPMAAGERQPDGPPPLVAASFGALLLLSLGAAVATLGLDALAAVHASLAICGAVGLVGAWRHNLRHARHRHP